MSHIFDTETYDVPTVEATSEGVAPDKYPKEVAHNNPPKEAETVNVAENVTVYS